MEEAELYRPEKTERTTSRTSNPAASIGALALAMDAIKYIATTATISILNDDKFTTLSTTSPGVIAFTDIEIKGEIGEGGQSTVRRGKWGNLDVALKVSKTAHEMLLASEAKMLRVIRNKHIVLLYGTTIDPVTKQEWLVMENMPEGSLHDRLTALKEKGSTIPIQEMISIALDVAEGLKHLHSLNIMHRDVKADNILLYDKYTRAKLIDLGCARQFTESRPNNYTIIGTPGYIAPEIRNEQHYDTKVDVFSFGVLLCQMYTNRLPTLVQEVQALAKEFKTSMLDLYLLLERCLDEKAEKRPTMDYCCTVLKQILVHLLNIRVKEDYQQIITFNEKSIQTETYLQAMLLDHIFHIAVVFKSKESFMQFNSWYESFSTKLVDGFLKAINEQQQRKANTKEKLFSNVIISSKKSQFSTSISILPADVEIQYQVDGKTVQEEEFPIAFLVPSCTTVEFKLSDSLDGVHSPVQTHNFVRYLAYHGGFMKEVPALDELTVEQTSKELMERNPGWILSNLADLGSSSKGVLIWGLVGADKIGPCNKLSNHLGVELVSKPLLLKEMLNVSHDQFDTAVDKLIRQAAKVPWKVVALAVDFDVDGLSSGQQINFSSLWRCFQSNLVLFVATNSTPKVDSTFLQRLHSHLFVGRPLAPTKKQWIQKVLNNITVHLSDKELQEYLTDVLAMTINYSRQDMQEFVESMETWDESCRSTYQNFYQTTVGELLSICLNKNIKFGNQYLPQWFGQWLEFDKIKTAQWPQYNQWSAYARLDSIQHKYHTVLPRLLIDLTQHLIEIKESFSHKELQQALSEPEIKIMQQLDRPDFLDQLRELSVLGEFTNLFEALIQERAKLSQKSSFANGQQILKAYCGEEGKQMQEALKKFVKQARLMFSKSVNTKIIEDTYDQLLDNEDKLLNWLLKFAVEGDMSCFHYIDAAWILCNQITEEMEAVQRILTAVQEASQYPSAMVAIDLDSLLEIQKGYDAKKSSSYTGNHGYLVDSIISFFKGDYQAWIAIICRSHYVSAMVRRAVAWNEETQTVANNDNSDSEIY